MEPEERVSELVRSELSLSKRELLDDLKDDLLKWAKRRFWFVSLLSVFGLVAVVNTLLQVTTGAATTEANKAAIEATMNASRAAKAIENIDATIVDASAATETANEKAQIATESALQAQRVAERANVEAERAAAATAEANDALDTLQSDRIKNLRDKLIGLEGEINGLIDRTASLERMSESISPEVSELAEEVRHSKREIDLAIRQLRSVTEEITDVEARISSAYVQISQAAEKSEAIDTAVGELELALAELAPMAEEVVGAVRSGGFLSKVVRRAAVEELEKYEEEMFISNRARTGTLRGIIQRGTHCSLPGMTGPEDLNEILEAAGYSEFGVEVYTSLDELMEAFGSGSCNFIIRVGSIAKVAINELEDNIASVRLRSQLVKVDGESAGLER